MTTKLSKTARTLLSVTALAWSIPFAQASGERLDLEETQKLRQLDGVERVAQDPRVGASPANDNSDGGTSR